MVLKTELDIKPFFFFKFPVQPRFLIGFSVFDRLLTGFGVLTGPDWLSVPG